MSRRKEFVTLAQSERANMSELCLRTGISRKTGYKWLRRYAKGGDEGLQDLSKRPHQSPNRTSAQIEQLVIDLRREHPTKGSHVLARMLQDRGYDRVPSKSTITAILRRNGLIERSESAKREPYRRFEHDEPNDLWQMDFKGHIPMRSGGRCHPLTVPGRPLQILCGDEGLPGRERSDRPGPPHVHLSSLRHALHHPGRQRSSLG